MSSITMLSEIIRGKVMSCCFPGMWTFVTRKPCNAARDWAGFCAITIKKPRDLPAGRRDQMGLADETDQIWTADQSGDQGTRRISSCRRQPRECNGCVHPRRLPLRGSFGTESRYAVGMDAVDLGHRRRGAVSGVCQRKTGAAHPELANTACK